jgi:hypothetical protein
VSPCQSIFGEITVIATAVLAAFSIIMAMVVYMTFRKPIQEVGILQQADKNKRKYSSARPATAAEPWRHEHGRSTMIQYSSNGEPGSLPSRQREPSGLSGFESS